MRKVLELNGKTEILSLYSVILLFQHISLLFLIAAEWMYHPYHFEMYQS